MEQTDMQPGRDNLPTISTFQFSMAQLKSGRSRRLSVARTGPRDQHCPGIGLRRIRICLVGVEGTRSDRQGLVLHMEWKFVVGSAGGEWLWLEFGDEGYTGYHLRFRKYTLCGMVRGVGQPDLVQLRS